MTIYAVLGVALLFCGAWPEKWLLFLAVVLTLNTPVILRNISRDSQTLDVPQVNKTEGRDLTESQPQELQYFNTLKDGELRQILAKNSVDVFKGKWLGQLYGGRLFITLGLFLFGFLVGKRQFFQNLDKH